jgi:hypothetical protein
MLSSTTGLGIVSDVVTLSLCGIPSDIRFANANEVRRRVVHQVAILLLADEVVLLRAMVRLIQSRMPEVDVD